MRDVIIGIVGVCALALLAAPTQAAIVTVHIEGVVDTVDDDGDYLDGLISPGDPIIGYYTYDTDTPDSSPDDSVQGNYWHYASPAGVFLTVGSLDFSADLSNVELQMFISNNTTSGNDIYGFYSFNNLSLSNGTVVDDIWWSIKDTTASVFSSDILPASAPVLSQWDENILNMSADRIYGIRGHVTSAYIVPEPATFFVLIAGALLTIRKSS